MVNNYQDYVLTQYLPSLFLSEGEKSFHSFSTFSEALICNSLGVDYISNCGGIFLFSSFSSSQNWNESGETNKQTNKIHICRHLISQTHVHRLALTTTYIKLMNYFTQVTDQIAIN